ncbi:MAG: TIGR04222 domain-containing membrane protein [Catenulispora sp.]|nr:TIGR04222 domain-containing membrane protein [Catenulispora sp.]
MGTIFGILAVAAVFAGVLALVVIGNRPAPAYAGPALTGEEMAFLNGGRGLAVQAAIASLRVAGGVIPARNGKPAVATLSSATPLERAVSGALVAGLVGPAIVRTPDVDIALDSLARSLQARGLINVREKRTKTGDGLLRAQRRQYAYLAPTQNPAWTTYGPAAAALGVGLFGAGVLATVDPELIGLFPIQRPYTTGATGTSDSGTYYGGDTTSYTCSSDSGGSHHSCSSSSCSSSSCSSSGCSSSSCSSSSCSSSSCGSS